MQISIAMATYNGAKYLQEQLDSFLQQTRLPDELVVCDDGSTDATVEILEAFIQHAPFAVHICRNETNLGYIKNFEKVLSLCTGDIIFLSDQDDVWFSNKIEEMAGILETRQDIFVLQTDMVLADEDMNPTSYTQLGNIRALQQSPDTFMFGCGTAVRKAWCDLLLPIPSDMVTHDNWIHRLALALDARALHDKPLQYFRRHGNNASNWLASNPVGMSQLDAFRAHGFNDASEGWTRELERSKATLERICERIGVLKEFGLDARQLVAVSMLSSQIKNLSHRIRIVKTPRITRLPHVLAMLMRGGYRQFSGWKSAAKDIFRP